MQTIGAFSKLDSLDNTDVTLISWLLGRKPQLTQGAEDQLQGWLALPATDLHTPFGSSRYVVVDVETSGLDPTRDKLIAIGAVAVTDGQVDLHDAFEAVMLQTSPSTHDNILVHGIGGTVQTGGHDPIDTLLEFLTFAGSAPLVAFHAAFDKTAIRLETRKKLNTELKQPWLDLAYLAPALYPDQAKKHRSLDDWIAKFGIHNFARHTALADAYATAQLLLILIRTSSLTNNAQSMADLVGLEKAQRILTRIHQ